MAPKNSVAVSIPSFNLLYTVSLDHYSYYIIIHERWDDRVFLYMQWVFGKTSVLTYFSLSYAWIYLLFFSDSGIALSGFTTIDTAYGWNNGKYSRIIYDPYYNVTIMLQLF